MTDKGPPVSPVATKPRVRHSLNRRYFAVMAGLVTAALVAGGLMQAIFAFRDSQANLLALESQEAHAAALQTSQFLTQVQTQMSWVVQPVFTPEAINLGQLREDFTQLLHQEPAITQVSYLDPAGKEQLRVSRVAVDEIERGTDRSSTAEFLQASGGKTYLGPVNFREGSEPYMTIAIGQRGPAGGVIACDVNLKFVWDVVTRITAGKDGFAYVVDATGHLIAHPDINQVLRHTDLSPLPQVRAALTSLPRATDGASPRTADPPPGSRHVLLAENPRGERVLTAWDYINGAGWTVFVEQPLGDAFAPLYSSIERTVLLMLIGIAVAVGLSTVLARSFTRPIQALRSGAALIGAGALQQRIEVRTGDELEELAEAFNDMAGKLSQSYATLEQKVEERTRELREATRQLEIASRHKSDFLAHMSHELRTPLNAIIGFSDVLLDPQMHHISEERRERYLNNIHRSGRHLLGLINDILDLSKIEAGRMDLFLEDVDLTDLVDGCLGIIAPLADKKDIALRSSCEPPHARIQADAPKLKQILYNLLSNAVKFTPEGGRVAVTASVSDGLARVEVRDSGIGIAAEDQALIFEEFRQVDQGAAGKEEGTGLGLALTRRLVELHGGTLDVESAPGEGSRFFFTLPARNGASNASGELTPSEPEGAEMSSGPRVLVVEDETEAAELLRLQLTRAGYAVRRVSTAADALAAIKTEPPFAITLDLMLPDRDGWELLTALKADPSTRDIAVIIVSVVNNRELGFALGATDYLVKPVDKQALLAALHRLDKAQVGASPVVLVVDDDPQARQLMAGALAGAPCRVLLAENGQEGLRLARSQPVDLLILDLVMPGMSGFEVVDELRRAPETRGLPVVICTAKALTAHERAELNGHVEAIIQKGAAADILEELIRLERVNPKLAGIINGRSGQSPTAGFLPHVERELSRAARRDSHFGIVVVCFAERPGQAQAGAGHEAELCGRVSAVLRSYDLVTCDEGEIMALLPDSSTSRVSAVLEKIREALTAQSTMGAGEFALGSACFPDDAQSAEDLIKLARGRAAASARGPSQTTAEEQ